MLTSTWSILLQCLRHVVTCLLFQIQYLAYFIVIQNTTVQIKQFLTYLSVKTYGIVLNRALKPVGDGGMNLPQKNNKKRCKKKKYGRYL